jgi:hypothetical protein
MENQVAKITINEQVKFYNLLFIFKENHINLVPWRHY